LIGKIFIFIAIFAIFQERKPIREGCGEVQSGAETSFMLLVVYEKT
jgi:hypothetical protein